MKAVAIVENSRQVATVIALVFLTDARSVEALTNNKALGIAQALKRLRTTHSVTMQWIPTQFGVVGNEHAQNEGAQTKEPNNPITDIEKVSIIKAVTKPRQKVDTCHHLSRAEKVVLVRLRSEHKRLRHTCTGAVSNLSM